MKLAWKSFTVRFSKITSERLWKWFFNDFSRSIEWKNFCRLFSKCLSTFCNCFSQFLHFCSFQRIFWSMKIELLFASSKIFTLPLWKRCHTDSRFTSDLIFYFSSFLLLPLRGNSLEICPAAFEGSINKVVRNTRRVVSFHLKVYPEARHFFSYGKLVLTSVIKVGGCTFLYRSYCWSRWE